MYKPASITGTNITKLEKIADIILQMKFAMESHGLIVGNAPITYYPEMIRSLRTEEQPEE